MLWVVVDACMIQEQAQRVCVVQTEQSWVDSYRVRDDLGKGYPESGGGKRPIQTRP